MPVSIHDTTPEPIKGTRGYLVMRICEGDDDLYVQGCVYDGSPQPLQTPEGVCEDTTTARVRNWAVDYAEQFLPEITDPEDEG
jgi:hypothetical protein